MIISASRRTDIPAFYTDWFMNRIRNGYCAVPNPFNLKQVSCVSLKPLDVDVIVFWTRNPQPIMRCLDELNDRGYRYYFQYTLMNNPRSIEPFSPPLDEAIRSFRKLSERIGPEKVIWRYDPVFFSETTDIKFHMATFQKIARALNNLTQRSVVSVVDIYKKNKMRIQEITPLGVGSEESVRNAAAALMPVIFEAAQENGMEVVSCAEDIDLTPYGIQPGKCVDDAYIKKIFGIDVNRKKDPAQRKACGCVVSRDIGMYDSCIFGCRYCYATSSFKLAKTNYLAHDSDSPSLVGRYEVASQSESNKQPTLWD